MLFLNVLINSSSMTFASSFLKLFAHLFTRFGRDASRLQPDALNLKTTNITLV